MGHVVLTRDLGLSGYFAKIQPKHIAQFQSLLILICSITAFVVLSFLRMGWRRSSAAIDLQAFFFFFFLANSCESVAVLMTCRQMSLFLAFLQVVYTPKF